MFTSKVTKCRKELRRLYYDEGMTAPEMLMCVAAQGYTKAELKEAVNLELKAAGVELND